jgi:hypothetical protein
MIAADPVVQYADAIQRRCASPSVAASAPIDCGLLALEILGLEVQISDLERELSDLRAVFAVHCMGTGTP